MKYLLLLLLLSSTLNACYQIEPYDYDPIGSRMREEIDIKYPFKPRRRTHTEIYSDNRGNVWVNGNDGYRAQGYWADNGSFYIDEY